MPFSRRSAARIIRFTRRCHLLPILAGLVVAALPSHALADCCNLAAPPAQTDIPDDAFTDSNGDGIDGMRCGPIFVALTGSDTSSNVLFGNLQQVTANQLHLSPIHMAASNSSGGVMGKMIDAQSIVVAAVATGGHADSPDAGTVLRSVFWHSIALALLMGVLVMAQAYWMPWMIVK